MSTTTVDVWMTEVKGPINLVEPYQVPPCLARASRETWREEWHPWPAELSEWKGEPWAIVFIGKPGRGKSHLAAARLRESLERNCSPRRRRWFDVPLLAEEIGRAIRFQMYEEHERLLMLARQDSLVVFDDFGAEAGEWAAQHAPLLLRYRYNHGLPTIVTCNADSVRDLQALDPRIASRLSEGLVIALGGKDRRGQ